MVNRRATDAIERIERALARIEITVASPPRTPEISRSHAELEQRHAVLKRELEAALTDIDQVIARSEAAVR